VSAPWQPAADTRGLLLVGGAPATVAAWVRRGLVACHVQPLGRWTAVVPAEPRSRAQPPYDDAVSVLAARPVPHRMRPTIGLFASAGRAVLTVQPRGWRGGQRWLVWEPGRGVIGAPGLVPARPADLVRATGSGRGIGAVLGDPAGDADRLVARVMEVLGLPGADVLRTGGTGPVVTPSPKAVSRFDARATEDARHRAELEEG